MSRFAVRFLGCKVSQADATLIRDALIDAGHVEAPPEHADVHVVNTCALTLEAERKSRQQVNRAARAGRTFVTGCAANLNGAQFAAEGVTVVGRSAERAAADIVALLGRPQPLGCQLADRPPGRTRAFVKVQNGCDQRCSFCIIPWTRGPAESRPLADVLRDCRRRLVEGHPELVLTGINIGGWRDPDAGADLGDLVTAIGRLDGVRRVRISSIEPGDVTPRLVAAMAATQGMGRHMHVPLQSGDADVLAAMGRSYTVERFRDACRWAREAMPGLNLTTDAIVGFPTEDEAAFRRTLSLVEEIGMAKVHVFPYSPRPGTAAAAMGDRVPPDVKAERSLRLRELSERLGREHRRRRAGQRDEVLVERALDDGTLVGYGSDYTRFALPAGAGEPGDLVAVEVAGAAGDHLAGRPVA